jgi:uncharacterized protein
MSTEPLPTSLDVRKAAARGVTLSGVLAPSELARAREILSSDTGRIEARLAFSRDEENRNLLTVEISAQVQVLCQRCLEPLGIEVTSRNELAMIGSEDRARDLPARLDPLVVEGESCDLWAVVEDELILALPIVSYHDTEACRQRLEPYTMPPVEAAREADSNPFSVLKQLKSSGNN